MSRDDKQREAKSLANQIERVKCLIASSEAGDGAFNERELQLIVEALRTFAPSTKKEHEYVNRIRERIVHLHARMEDTELRDTQEITKELHAFEWALPRLVASPSHGLTNNAEPRELPAAAANPLPSASVRTNDAGMREAAPSAQQPAGSAPLSTAAALPSAVMGGIAYTPGVRPPYDRNAYKPVAPSSTPASEVDLAYNDAALARLRAYQRDIEEAEARCCPQDFGFEEWIGILTKRLDAARSATAPTDEGLQADRALAIAECIEAIETCGVYTTTHPYFVRLLRGLVAAVGNWTEIQREETGK